eukprot:TRINITY_DN34079_c0_g1_i2.p1 TRINITY_DN34079_c0_g1~~TRINITY_DN34079_c0_g1_i2.p1  ORF type:complete len:476 (+),score=103.95 TRINITY_DN34079_c0_g1_i2:79-1428(+)
MAMTMSASGRELNARQRKNVYMHSTIFSEGGPTEKSVYAPARQHELLSSISPNLRKNNQSTPDIDLPSPADIAATQHAGHGVAMPSSHAHHQPIEGQHARVSNREALVGEAGLQGDAIRVVQAQGRDGTIPREFWATSVNVNWHDPRNEISRARETPSERSAQDKKINELSSEIFGKERLLTASASQRGELLADTAHVLQKDTSLDRTAGRRDPAASANRRFHGNLRHSDNNTHAHATVTQEAKDVGPAREDENPAFRARRRQEKNFSDLFDVQMAERQDLNKRGDIVHSHTCSFLDTRSEIAVRNQTGWRSEAAASAQDRAEAERRSALFNGEPPMRPELEVHTHERCYWETKDGMQIGSEIARRRRLHDHHAPDGEVRGSAFDRKHGHLASDQMRRGMGADPAAFSPRTDADNDTYRARQRNAGGYISSSVSAKETKLASLQSSIFG